MGRVEMCPFLKIGSSLLQFSEILFISDHKSFDRVVLAPSHSNQSRVRAIGN